MADNEGARQRWPDLYTGNDEEYEATPIYSDVPVPRIPAGHPRPASHQAQQPYHQHGYQAQHNAPQQHHHPYGRQQHQQHQQQPFQHQQYQHQQHQQHQRQQHQQHQHQVHVESRGVMLEVKCLRVDEAALVALPLESTEEEVETARRQLSGRVYDGRLLERHTRISTEVEGIPKSVRVRADPYRSLGTARFDLKDAVLMANLDHTVQLVPSTSDRGFDASARFSACDLGAPRTGFTEFVLWKRERAADCFAVTSNRDVLSSRDGCFHVKHVDEAAGWAQCAEALTAAVDAKTRGQGAFLVISAGENASLTAPYTSPVQQTLCKMLVMYRVLKSQGLFLLELEDTTSPAMVSILYLLTASFRKVVVTKPVAADPTSSRRFAVCVNLHTRRPPFLRALEEALPRLSPCAVPLVSIDRILATRNFVDFLANINNRLLRHEIDAMERAKRCSEDSDRQEGDPEAVKAYVLKAWGIDSKSRSSDHRRGPGSVLPNALPFVSAAPPTGMSRLDRQAPVPKARAPAPDASAQTFLLDEKALKALEERKVG